MEFDCYAFGYCGDSVAIAAVATAMRCYGFMFFRAGCGVVFGVDAVVKNCGWWWQQRRLGAG